MQREHSEPFRLNVPITDAERLHSRDDSNEFLLTPVSRDDNSRHSQNTSSSISYISPRESSSGQVSLEYDPRQAPHSYVPVEPIHEDDEDIEEPREQIQRSNSGYAPINQLPHFWRPLWLRRLVLTSFLVLFAGLLAALLLLRHYDDGGRGYGVATSTSHYVWTYLPTTVLVVLVGLWRPVDYYCKALTPWAELRKGPATASKSILLDYISPVTPVSCYRAIRNKHWAVVAGITSLWILKLMVRRLTLF